MALEDRDWYRREIERKEADEEINLRMTGTGYRVERRQRSVPRDTWGDMLKVILFIIVFHYLLKLI